MKRLDLLIVLSILFILGLKIFTDNFSTDAFEISVLIAIFATYLAQRLSNEARDKSEELSHEHNFSNFVKAMIMECGDNISRAKQLITSLSSSNFNFARFDHTVSQNLLTNQLFYKYLSESHFINLRLYIYQIDLLHSRLDFIYSEFLKIASISQKNLDEVKEELTKLEKITLILEISFQLFANIFDSRFGPKSSDDTLKKLKNLKKITIEDLEKELNEVSKMSESDRKNLVISYRNAFKNTFKT